MNFLPCPYVYRNGGLERALISPAIKRAAKIAILEILLVPLVAIAPVQTAPLPATSQDAQVLHLLNRITFGPRPGDIEAVKRIGVERFIEQQLQPEVTPLPDFVSRVRQFESMRLTPAQLFLRYGPPVVTADTKAFRRASARSPEPAAASEGSAASTSLASGASGGEARMDAQKKLAEIHRRIYEQVAGAKITRVLYSPRQLEEVMTDFWFNHFNVAINKGLDHLWTGIYEERAIRPYALGRFRDLLGATSHHAAMLFYLDNWQNTAPGSRGARGRFKGINENYARELLELHTLGVDGGYTQKDVVELARILTGLGLQGRRAWAAGRARLDDPWGYSFDANRHDFSDKVLLGVRIRGSGEQEIEQALDMLARHPSTARHISFKLAQYFVADKPPESLVKKLQSRFMETDGDIRQVLRALVYSPEFWSEKAFSGKFKSPQRYLWSCLRATEATVEKSRPLLFLLNRAGMPLYRCQTPDGYKNTAVAWLSAGALTDRLNLATAIGTGRMPGIRLAEPDHRRLMELVGARMSASTRQAIAQAPPPLKVPLILGSPEFMLH